MTDLFANSPVHAAALQHAAPRARRLRAAVLDHAAALTSPDGRLDLALD